MSHICDHKRHSQSHSLAQGSLNLAQGMLLQTSAQQLPGSSWTAATLGSDPYSQDTGTKSLMVSSSLSL